MNRHHSDLHKARGPGKSCSEESWEGSSPSCFPRVSERLMSPERLREDRGSLLCIGWGGSPIPYTQGRKEAKVCLSRPENGSRLVMPRYNNLLRRTLSPKYS